MSLKKATPLVRSPKASVGGIVTCIIAVFYVNAKKKSVLEFFKSQSKGIMQVKEATVSVIQNN